MSQAFSQEFAVDPLAEARSLAWTAHRRSQEALQNTSIAAGQTALRETTMPVGPVPQETHTESGWIRRSRGYFERQIGQLVANLSDFWAANTGRQA
jgi:hypothetical protein